MPRQILLFLIKVHDLAIGVLVLLEQVVRQLGPQFEEVEVAEPVLELGRLVLGLCELDG